MKKFIKDLKAGDTYEIAGGEQRTVTRDAFWDTTLWPEGRWLAEAEGAVLIGRDSTQVEVVNA